MDGERVDVAVVDGVIAGIGPGLDGDEVVDAAGGAVLPGLHDHHLHLLAMAAARQSLDVSEAHDPVGFDRAVAGSDRDRVVGYHEHDHGPLDDERLDRLAPGRALRIQHATGAAWYVQGEGWTHDPDPQPAVLDLAAVGSDLAAVGVTGVTDATPFDDPTPLVLLAALPQRVVAMGGLGLMDHPGLSGPVKLVVADHEVPDPTGLARLIAAAHATGRPVAVHCVTAVALAVLLAAWDEVGAEPGDRVEHGAVVAPAAVVRLRELGVTVVTQPNFVRERGDRYRAEVEPADQPDLWRCASLVAGGVPLAAGTDAPFGRPDPWVAMAAAVERRTRSGASLGSDEALTPRQALDLFLGPPDDPGGPSRRVEVGAPADLCVLDRPLADALAALDDVTVRATLVAGRPVHLGA